MADLFACVLLPHSLSLSLLQYGEYFHDRTVVDLKDKWRNLKV